MMKNYILLFIVLLSFSAKAQMERRTVQDLSSYAPLNPEGGDYLFPKPLQNKNIATITVVNAAGQATQRTTYNEKGWPIYVETGSLKYDYYYAPNAKRITRNNDYIYDLNANGKVVQHYDFDRYRNTDAKTEYTYDANGNLTKREFFKRKQVKKGQFALKSQNLTSYSYDDKNRVLAEKGVAYQYDYNYQVANNQLIITTSKSDKKMSESTYDANGNRVDFKMFSYGNQHTKYDRKYDAQGLLLEEKTTSTTPSENKVSGYIYTFRDGATKSPTIAPIKFVDSKKTDNVYTKATANFKTMEGFFEKGKLNGPGFMTQNGSVLKGDFKNNVLNGFGTEVFPVAESYVTYGMFENGVLNGYGFKVKGKEVIEAGVYKNGKLVKDLAKDYLAKKENLRCKGDCENGFGIKKDENTFTYSFFENGTAIGPYAILSKDFKMVQSGAKAKGYHYVDGLENGKYYFGLLEHKKGKAKIAQRSQQTVEAGIMKNGTFEKKYEMIIK